MHPVKAAKVVSEDIRELDMEFQSGLRAKELVETEHYKRVKDLVAKERELFNRLKIATPIATFIRTSEYTKGDKLYFERP